ncbi:hypothetical protein U2086_14875, partial [Listeria monocytogenes]|uniref:hypothetical protein n=1 Tax=Listeria monocytogenes TaxID=1639 RepID=UPI002FDC1E75
KRSTMEVKYLAYALKESSDLLDHALPVDLLVAASTAKKARSAAKAAGGEAMAVAVAVAE